jgi:hypothetical protein
MHLTRVYGKVEKHAAETQRRREKQEYFLIHSMFQCLCDWDFQVEDVEKHATEAQRHRVLQRA